MQFQGSSEKQVRALLGMFTGKYNTLIHIPLAFANALGASLIPSLTGAVSLGDSKEIRNKIGLVIRVVMLIAIPSCVAFMVIPNQILSLLYVGNITIPANMLRIGAISVVFYCLSTITNSILQGLNKMSTPVKHGAISLGVHLIAVVILLVVFHSGIYSLVIGNIVFSLCMCILNSRAMKKASGYQQEVKKTFLIPSIAAVVMGIVLILLWHTLCLFTPDKLATIVSIVVAIPIYAIALLKMGALTKHEIIALPKGKKLYALLNKLHLLKEENAE
jgi:stage V sporulation protein B